VALLYIALYGHGQRVPTETPRSGASAGSPWPLKGQHDGWVMQGGLEPGNQRGHTDGASSRAWVIGEERHGQNPPYVFNRNTQATWSY
jgi:hypothetical protein